MSVLVMVAGHRCEALAQVRVRDGVLRFYRIVRTGRVIAEAEGFTTRASRTTLEAVAGVFEDTVHELLVAQDPPEWVDPDSLFLPRGEG